MLPYKNQLFRSIRIKESYLLEENVYDLFTIKKKNNFVNVC